MGARIHGQKKGDKEMSDGQEDELTTQLEIFLQRYEIMRKEWVDMVGVNEEEGGEGEGEW